MEQLGKSWESLSKENQHLLKKGVAVGIVVYILLLIIHDLLPYALTAIGLYFLYQWAKPTGG